MSPRQKENRLFNRLSAAMIALFLFSFPMFSPYSSHAQEKDLQTLIESVSVEGDPAELRAYIDAHPKDELIDRAIFRLAQIYINKKEFAKAAEQCQRLIENFPASPYKFDSLYLLGYTRYRTGRISDAKSALEAVEASGEVKEELKAKARMLLSEISSPVGATNIRRDMPAIGVLLPLKGNFSRFGEDALNGILLAADVFGGNNGAVEVITKNVGNDGASVVRAIEELSSNPNIMGLVGPLFSSTAVEAANESQKNRMPIITLTQKEGITGAGEYVFRNFLTPQSQASALADYACNTKGLKRFAILYPKNNYGTELAKAFEAEVKRQGGIIVRQAPYAQGTADFSDEIRRLFGVQTKERKEGRRVIKEYNPILKVDALFIPDSEEAVGLIAPYLKYYNIKDVRLLGSNGWNSPRLVELAGDNIEGALFVDGFFPGSRRDGTVEFTGRFRNTYGKAPGVLEAQAYDAASILIAAIKDAGGSGADRAAVMRKLRDIKGFKGAAGQLSFDSAGEANKKLFILTVKDGRIEEALQ